MARVKLYLFGSFRATLDEQPIHLRSDKTRALLAYLALEGAVPIARPHLGQLLWDNFRDDSARTNLRAALSNLRVALGDLDPLHATYQNISFNQAHPDLWCDAWEFEKLSAQRPITPALVEAAQNLYQREFLDDFHKIDSEPFLAWVATRRKHFRQLMDQITAQATSSAAVTETLNVSPPHNLPRQLTSLIGRSEEIEALAQRLLTPDMLWLTLTGEGGIGKTRLALALAERLLPFFPDGAWFVPLVELQGLAPETIERFTTNGGGTQSANPQQNEGETPTGEIMQALLQERLAGAVGTVLHVAFQGQAPLQKQLNRYLQRKQLLLVLDNFEHLVPGATFIAELLQAAPHVKVIVTSRQRLGFQAEHLVRVEGLAWPDVQVLNQPEQRAGITAYASIVLFLERAKRINAQFQLHPDNQIVIAQICQMMEGLPLGIELAAALLDQYSPSQLLSALQENLALLATPLRDMPVRLRKIHSVLHHSWHLIGETERAVLMRCALFRGGFTAEAAEAVATATPAILALLVQHSLLRQADDGRFHLHELVRRYVADRLHEDAQAEQEQKTRHCDYYANLLAAWTDQNQEMVAKQPQVVVELDNLWAVWLEATQISNHAAIERSFWGMSHLYSGLGLYAEAESTFAAVARFLRGYITSSEPTQHDQQRLLAECLLMQSYWARQLGHLDHSSQLTAEGLQIGEATGDATVMTRGYLRLGETQIRQGEYQAATATLEKGLALAMENGLTDLEYGLLNVLGVCHGEQGRRTESIRYFSRALPLARQAKAHKFENDILINLGTCQMEIGNYGLGMEYYQQSLALSQQMADQPGAGFALLNIGASYKIVGEFSQALAAIEQALTIFRTAGKIEQETAALAEKGILHHYLGNSVQALHYGKQAVALTQTYRIIFIGAIATMFLGLSNLGIKDWAEARQHFEGAEAICKKLGLIDFGLVAKAGLASIHLQQNEPTTALLVVDEIITQMQSVALDDTADPGFVFLTCYQVLQANRDRRASTLLQQGYDHLLDRANKIDNVSFRHSFMHNVATNHLIHTLITG